MTYSLRVVNGDLGVSGPGGLATVTGQQKLVQDLRHWLLEPRGTDPMHPNYGSNLDGGLLGDGTQAAPMVGGLITDETLTALEGEVRRILAAYQQQQADRLNAESATFRGKNTFALGEILASVDDIQVTQSFSTVFVHIVITTANGDSIAFTAPVTL